MIMTKSAASEVKTSQNIKKFVTHESNTASANLFDFSVVNSSSGFFIQQSLSCGVNRNFDCGVK